MNRIHYLFLIVFALFACNPEQPLGGWTHYYETTQCADPWGENSENKELSENVEKYLNDNQIEIKKIQVKSVKRGAVCFACVCQGTQRIDVKVDEANGDLLLELEVPGSLDLKWKAY